MRTEYSWKIFLKCGHSEEREDNGNYGTTEGGWLYLKTISSGGLWILTLQCWVAKCYSFTST